MPTATYACRINQQHRNISVGQVGINRIPGGTSNWAHDGAFLPQELIKQAGFPYIGFTNDSNLDRIILDFFALFFEGGDQNIQHVPGTSSMQGRYWIWFPQAKL